MIPRRALALMLALIAAPLPAQDARRGGRSADQRGFFTDPADIITTELAFARLAQAKGQWTALRDTAAPGAQLFDPLITHGQPARAADFLRSRADPPAAVAWQPHQVWESCDGSFAVTRGAWQRGGTAGYFITIWQRQPRGTYKWVVTQGDILPTPLPPADFIDAKLADCPQRARRALDEDGARRGPRPPAPARRAPGAPPSDYVTGHSGDGTLEWATQVGADGGRTFILQMQHDGRLHEMLRATVKPRA